MTDWPQTDSLRIYLDRLVGSEPGDSFLQPGKCSLRLSLPSPFMRFLKILTRVYIAFGRAENADSGPGAMAQGLTGAPTPPGPTSLAPVECLQGPPQKPFMVGSSQGNSRGQAPRLGRRKEH